MKGLSRARQLLRGSKKHPDVDPDADPLLGEECRTWRQGDVFDGARTYMFDWKGRPRPIESAHGAAVVSQSCDASLPGRDRVQIAPVVRLTNPDDRREAASGRRTQYVSLPRLGEDMFADLDGITTVAKTALLSCSRKSGVESDDEVREFAFSVARRFGRFAYPDEVVECLDPLTRTLQSKARKEKSPLGKALAQVHSFRVYCEDWSATPRDLTLIVIMEPGVVPPDIELLGAPPADLVPPTGTGLAAQVNGYATRLEKTPGSTEEKYYAWEYLAEAWALQCEDTTRSKNLEVHVRSVIAEIVSVDDFPLSRYLESHSLDLDYLSDSRTPLQ